MTTVVKKIDDLPAMTDTVANNDELVMLDVSASAVDMTKLITMSQIPISQASQLGANVVTSAAIANDAVGTSEIATGAVTPVKIAAMTSAELKAIVSDETGSGALVFATSPILVTPALGTPASGTLTNCAGLPYSGLVAMTSANLASKVSDKTGTGKLVFATSPTLVTPILGTPTSGVLTNCTGLPTTGLVDDAVTEAKLGAIKRTVAIPLFGWDDVVIGTTFTNVFRWPPMLNGHNVTGARAVVLQTVSSSGNITLTISNAGGTMSTITISAGNVAGTSTIATAYKAATQDEPVTVVVAYGGNTAYGLTLYLEVTG